MVKAKAAAANMRIPQNRDDAAKMISEFGAVALKVEAIETEMKADLAKVKKAAETRAKAHVAKAKELFDGLKLYCGANRQTLLGNTGLKSIDFGTGKVAWRFKPAKVTLSGDVDDIITTIQAKIQDAIGRGASGDNYAHFLREIVEIDKESMLKNPDLARTIDGVKIGSGGETFEVEPFGAELAEAAQ